MIKPIKKINTTLPNKVRIKGQYYYDHSGYVEVIYKRDQIFCQESGRAQDQLEYLAYKIEELELLKSAYQFLKNEIKKMPKPVEEDPDEDYS